MSRSSRLLAFTLIPFLGLVSACATLMQGTTQEVGISSTPSRATVSVNGVERGTTPVAVDLKRKDQHTIRLTVEGYEPYELSMTRSTSGWVWGNIVFGGVIGLAVDAITGGLYKLEPQQVQAELLRSDAVALSVPPGEDGVHVFVTLQPRVEWQPLDVPGLERRW